MSSRVHVLEAQAPVIAKLHQRTPSKHDGSSRQKKTPLGSPSSPWAFSTILSGDVDLDAEEILKGQLRRFEEENGKKKEEIVSSRYGSKITPATLRRKRLAEEAERSAHADEEALRQSQRRPLEEEEDENDRFVTFDYWKKRMLIHETSQSNELREHNEGLRVQASGDREKLRQCELARQRASRRVVSQLPYIEYDFYIRTDGARSSLSLSLSLSLFTSSLLSPSTTFNPHSRKSLSAKRKN